VTEKIGQLFSGANAYIHMAEYISGDGWWLDKEGHNWWNRRAHFRYNAIYLPKVGEFDLCINGEWHRITPGHLVFIPADSDLEFCFDGNGPLEKYYIHFDLTFGANQLSDYFKIPSVILLQQPARTEQLFADLRRCYTESNDNPIAQLAANGFLLTLVAELLRQGNASFTHAPENLSKEMRETLEYINAHFGENLSVAELADRVGYSTAYFTKKFKKVFGTTPTDYVADLRISYAKLWLADKERSVHDVAEALGFCDASHFSNFFKAKTGLYPSYYRKNK